MPDYLNVEIYAKHVSMYVCFTECLKYIRTVKKVNLYHDNFTGTVKTQ